MDATKKFLGRLNMKKTTIMITLLIIALGLFSGCGQDIAAPTTDKDTARYSSYYIPSGDNLLLTWASMNYNEYTYSYDVFFQGNILLKNLAYEKVVFIRYTTDGWKTWKDIPAKYAFSQGDLETWKFQTENFNFPRTGPQQSLTEVVNINFDFAVCYKVNGNSYWDSNNNKNYHMDQNIRYLY